MATPSDSFGGPGGSFGSDRNPSGEGNDPFDRNRFRQLGGDTDRLGRRGRRRLTPVERRLLEERLRMANRLGFTQTILGGRPPTAGKAGTLKKQPTSQRRRILDNAPLPIAEIISRRQRDG